MKISHIATVALLAASAISSFGAIGLVVHQYTVQRSAVQVVADTALVERMQGLADAIDYVPMSERHALLSEYGFLNEKALQTALPAQRRDLESAQHARAEELSTNDKRFAALLAICGFNAIVAVMSGIAFYDIAARRRRHLSEEPANVSRDDTRPEEVQDNPARYARQLERAKKSPGYVVCRCKPRAAESPFARRRPHHRASRHPLPFRKSPETSANRDLTEERSVVQ